MPNRNPTSESETGLDPARVGDARSRRITSHISHISPWSNL